MAANTNNIIIKDRYGNDVVYEGVSRIRTGTTEGGTKEFVIADDIPNPVETTVELDFSEGDMVVEPSAAEVFSKVNITKPETLITENIAEGVDIAGVVGTLDIPDVVETSVELDFSEGDMDVSSDDGMAFEKVIIVKPETLVSENIAEGVDIAGIVGTMAAAKGALVATGRVTGNGGELTITHNLGVIPDVVVVSSTLNVPYPQTNLLLYAADISTPFYMKIGMGMRRVIYSVTWPGTGKITGHGNHMGSYNCVENVNTAPGINSANAQTFKVGSSTYKTFDGGNYYWYAIGGLT